MENLETKREYKKTNMAKILNQKRKSRKMYKENN